MWRQSRRRADEEGTFFLGASGVVGLVFPVVVDVERIVLAARGQAANRAGVLVEDFREGVW